MRSALALLALALGLAACRKTAPQVVARPQPMVPPETVTVRDPEVERRASRLEVRLLEREAQIEELQARLEDARQEVVRAMARLPAVASRAEAASAMAEAEVALQSLRASTNAQTTEAAQVASLVRQSSGQFDRQNFGGALYLANQAKALSATYRARLSQGIIAGMRAGETPFAVPIRLRVTSRGNVRDGPGTNFAIVRSVEAGSLLTGTSFVDEWIRVTDEAGRSGWIFRALVARP